MDYVEKIYYLNHAIEELSFSQAKKVLLIISIVFIVLLLLSIVLKDFVKLKNTKKLIRVLLIFCIIAELTAVGNCAYRYYFVYQYENHYNDWQIRILDESIKKMGKK